MAIVLIGRVARSFDLLAGIYKRRLTFQRQVAGFGFRPRQDLVGRASRAESTSVLPVV